MNMKNEMKSAMTSILFVAAISCNMALAVDLPAPSDVIVAKDEVITLTSGSAEIEMKVRGEVIIEVMDNGVVIQPNISLQSQSAE